MKLATLEALRQKFDFVELRESLDIAAVNIPQERAKQVLTYLNEEWDFNILVDVTAIDNSEDPQATTNQRFTVVYHVYSTFRHEYFRVASDCVDDVSPSMETVCDIWPGANWHEREAYDMFGIEFKGHPNMKRILMWDDYGYYPLRKEFPLAGIETELAANDVAERTGAKVIAAPMMGGPFRAPQCGTMKNREPEARDESWTEKSEKPQETV